MTEPVPTPEPAPAPAPAPTAAPKAPSRFTRANLRRIALSSLKAFVAASAAVVVAKEATLGGLTPSDLQAVGLAALVAGLDAAGKVAQVFLEDNSE